jgi:lysophospholipase L1-like esterase
MKTHASLCLFLVFCASAPLPVISTAGEPDAIIKPGDHIAIIGNSFADMMRKHGFFETLLLQNHEDVSVRNLGWAGDTLTIRQRPTNFPTEDQTLTSHQTDLIFVCFGMGESFDGEAGLDSFNTNLSKLVSHYQSQKYNGASAPRLVLVSPIAYENLGEITPAAEQRNQDLAAYTAVMENVATEHDTAFVDLFTPTLALAGKEDSPHLTTNGIRLNEYGYWIASHFLAQAFLPDASPWLIEIDAAGNKHEATGLTLSGLEATSGGLQFKVQEPGWASPPPPALSTHAPLPFNRDRLAIRNLEPAYYTLTVDGEPVATATHEEWARGVPVDASPAHREADQYRHAVNDKNNQFFYSWRALNQVHIVGERKSSPSGQSLPAEVIEFNQLADEGDESLRTTNPPAKTREWKLIANPEKKLP